MTCPNCKSLLDAECSVLVHGNVIVEVEWLSGYCEACGYEVSDMDEIEDKPEITVSKS